MDSVKAFLEERPQPATPVEPRDPRDLDELLGPPPLHELERRFSDVNYTPTDYEIGRFLDLRKEKGLNPSEWPRKAAAAVGEIAGGIKDAALALPGAIADPGSGVQSVMEGVQRAWRNTELLGKKVNRAIRIGPAAYEKTTPEQERDAAIQQFRAELEDRRQTARLASGEEQLAPRITGEADPKLVEGVAMAADPLNYIPLGVGAVGKAGSVLERAAGRALTGAGKATEKAADLGLGLLESARNAPLRAAEAMLGEGTEQAARLAPAIGRLGDTAVAGAAGALGVANPLALGGLVATAVSPAVAKMAGQGMSAVGRNLVRPTFRAQLGLLGNIAKDAAAPEWLRAAAEFARPVDPLLSVGGRALKGGAEGATIGGALGALTDGEEGFASGLGQGGFFGSIGGAAGRLSRKERFARAEADLETWKSSLPPEAAVLIDQTLPRKAEQHRLMNAQRFLAGLGDVDVQYLTDAQWKAEGLPAARAMETTPGDRPIVKVNVNQIGNGSPVLHEAGHVLRKLMPDQFRELDQMLFSDFTLPEGQAKGTDFTSKGEPTRKGLLSKEEQQKLYDQYFAKLPPEIQAERRAGWSQAEHLTSLREEVVSELLSGLLQDKRPDYLLNLGGVKNRILDKLLASPERSLLSRIPGLDRLKRTTGTTGSELFTLDGQPLKVTGQTAAALRQLLRARDRVTTQLHAGDASEAAGALGTVGPREMLGPDASMLARLYGNSDTYAKDASGNVQFSPDKRPVLLDEGAVRKLTALRKQHLDRALGSVTPGPRDTIVVGTRELHPVRLAENGKNWEGHYLTDSQLAAMERDIPKNIITPQQFADIRRLNDAIKTGRGIRKGVDYNPATREKGRTGGRQYASMGSKYYDTVPYGFFINQEGGLSFRLFDAGNIERKLSRWMSDPKSRGQFALWNGDSRAVMADVYKYLDNQMAGRPNSVHLDDNPTFAVQKRNLITDLLGGRSVPEGVLPTPLSTKRARDNSVKTFRIDRINQLSEGSAQPMPIDYYKVKQNLMPLEVGRTLAEAGKDFPVDKVVPKLLDVGVKNEELTRRSGEAFAKLPKEVRASDGSDVKIWNPEGGSISRRVYHLARDEESGRVVPSKVRWIPMIAETLREAPAWILDPASGNRIYVREYDRFGKHMVVVRPDGQVIDQGPTSSRLITQFPYSSGGKQEGMIVQWVRPGLGEGGSKVQHGDPGPARPAIMSHASGGPRREGEGQSQGNPSPTPTGSTVPEPRQSEFQGKPTALPGPVKPPRTDSLPPGVTPTAVIQHIEGQTTTDLRQELIQGGAPPALADDLAQVAWTEANRVVRRRSAPHERGYAMRAGVLMESLGPSDMAAIQQATIKGGTQGAKAEMQNRLRIDSALVSKV